MSRWDAYGNWEVIAHNPVDVIRQMITGSRWGWRENFCSPALGYVFDHAVREYHEATGRVPTALDFGFGLGRNGPMLKTRFPRLTGFDLPEMVDRYRADIPDAAATPLYDALYTSTAALAEQEDICLVYDSVVLQHLADPVEVEAILAPLLARPSLRSFVTISNSAIDNPTGQRLLLERGWQLWHSEVETLSFQGYPHTVAVFRRWDTPGGQV